MGSKTLRCHMFEADRSVTAPRLNIEGRSLQEPKAMRAWLLDPKGNIRRCGNSYIAVLSSQSWRPPTFGNANSDYGEAALAFDRETRIENKVAKAMPIIGEIPWPLTVAILVGVAALIGLATLVALKGGYVSYHGVFDHLKSVVHRG